MSLEIGKLLKRIVGKQDELLFPGDVLCLCCDRALDDGAQCGVCKSCRCALALLALEQEARETELASDPLPEGIAYVHAAYPYEGAARRLIHRLKYESVRAAAVPLAQAMAYLPSGEEEAIVPVPTDKRRMRRRGFNQATMLADEIGRMLGMQVVPALHRIQARCPQTGLSGVQRRENLRGCMAVRLSDRKTVAGRRILLVDDVYTTGATVQEAARALLAAGAKSVGVFAAARAGTGMDEQTDPFALTRRR